MNSKHHLRLHITLRFFIFSLNSYLHKIMTKSINNPLRRLIYYHFKVLKRPSFEIHNDLLNVPNQGFSCTLRYLEDLLLKLENEEFAMHWIL